MFATLFSGGHAIDRRLDGGVVLVREGNRLGTLLNDSLLSHILVESQQRGNATNQSYVPGLETATPKHTLGQGTAGMNQIQRQPQYRYRLHALFYQQHAERLAKSDRQIWKARCYHTLNWSWQQPNPDIYLLSFSFLSMHDLCCSITVKLRMVLVIDVAGKC